MSANTVPFPAQSRLFGKYFEYSRYNDVVRAMHGMLAGIPDGQACVLSTLEGHHLAHAAAPMLDAPRLAAVASALSSPPHRPRRPDNPCRATAPGGNAGAVTFSGPGTPPHSNVRLN